MSASTSTGENSPHTNTVIRLLCLSGD